MAQDAKPLGNAVWQLISLVQRCGRVGFHPVQAQEKHGVFVGPIRGLRSDEFETRMRKMVRNRKKFCTIVIDKKEGPPALLIDLPVGAPGLIGTAGFGKKNPRAAQE